MRSTIQQSVLLPAPPETLFEMYLDPGLHAAFTGYPVAIGAEAGAPFQAFGGQLSGQILVVVRPRLIVQSWRSVKFNASDADSTLILGFSDDRSQPSSGRIDLVHLDVPPHDYHDVIEGWHKYYWNPWRAYLEH
jgi:uncharacterized protein YndB with AHSA1/START domain